MDQTFTGELSGVDSAWVLRQVVLLCYTALYVLKVF